MSQHKQVRHVERCIVVALFSHDPPTAVQYQLQLSSSMKRGEHDSKVSNKQVLRLMSTMQVAITQHQYLVLVSPVLQVQ